MADGVADRKEGLIMTPTPKDAWEDDTVEDVVENGADNANNRIQKQLRKSVVLRASSSGDSDGVFIQDHTFSWRNIRRMVVILILIISAVMVVLFGMSLAIGVPFGARTNNGSSTPGVGPEAEELAVLIQSRMPSTSFNDASSPQTKALRWLSTDAYSLDQHDDRIVQRFALATLFHSFNGPSSTATTWEHGAWLTNSSECSWGHAHHVRCTDEDSPVVVGLGFWHDDLWGTVPAELGLLTEMTRLVFYKNLALMGELPSEIGLLKFLTEVRIEQNEQLQGRIPTELGLLTKLTWMSLKGNSFAGSIPKELGHLTDLTGLFLDNNQLSESIPTELGALTQVTELGLNENDLKGRFPSQLQKLTDLESLLLFGNRITGNIPVEMCAASTITIDCDGRLECDCCFC